MRIAASLLLYGTLVAVTAAVPLAGMARRGRAPRLGVLAWQAATASVVVSWTVGALALAVPVLPASELAQLFASCLATVREAADIPGLATLRLAGFAAAAALAGWVIWCVAAVLVQGRRRRRRHGDALRIVGRPLPGTDAVLLDDPVPLAYCIPGRPGRIVVSRGALDALTGPELRAVLAHEQAHLAARHHLVLGSLHGLARAFRRLPLFARAPAEVARLLEMCADDAAARRHGVDAIAGALSSLSRVGAPVGTLAATDSTAGDRIARLRDPDAHRDRWEPARLAVVTFLLATGPLLAAAAPLAAATVHHLRHCPVPFG